MSYHHRSSPKNLELKSKSHTFSPKECEREAERSNGDRSIEVVMVDDDEDQQIQSFKNLPHGGSSLLKSVASPDKQVDDDAN